MRALGISLGHDTNFALVEDGRVVTMMEAELRRCDVTAGRRLVPETTEAGA